MKARGVLRLAVHKVDLKRPTVDPPLLFQIEPLYPAGAVISGLGGKGRLLLLLPEEPMLNNMPASKFCTSSQEIQDALDEAEQVREEGIIIKVSRLLPHRKGMSDCIVQITFGRSLVWSL